MKLGILCTMINGFGRRGFYNTQEIGLGRALAHKGHEVTIYKCLKKKADEAVDRVEIEPGLVIYYIPISGLGAHGYLNTDIIDKDLDAVLTFSDNQIFLPHIYRFCKKNNIKFVPYVGTTFSLHSGLHAWAMDTIFHLGTLNIFKENKVIAKTSGAKAELEALGVHDIVIGPVGLDLAVLKSDFASFDKNELRKEFGFEEDDVILCNVARLEAEKRALDLLDILKEIRKTKNFKLLLVGEGPLREEIDAKVKQLELTPYVHIINRIPYDQMWKVYTLSDYFVNLNKGEIFGMAIMESVYYQTSVAASMAPGPSLTLNGMEGHKLCNDDEELKAWLCADYPSSEVLRESAEKMAEQFSWNNCADKFLEIISETK